MADSGQATPDTGKVTDTAGDVTDKAGDVTDAAGDATDSAGDATDAATSQGSGDDDGVVRQLRKVAGGALLAALAPVVKDAVTTAAEKAVKKGPELLSGKIVPKVAAAGGAKAIAGVAKDKLTGGEDGDGLLSKLPGVGGGGEGASPSEAPDGVGRGRRMPIQQAVDVAVPVAVAYNQFTQFEDFPKFMHRVERVEQRDEAHVTFRSKQWKVNRQWEAEITDQRPDERIAFRSVSGVKLAGVVTFHPLGERLTRIELNVEFDPDGVFEKMGRGMRFAKRSIRADLHRFKAYVEMREQESGEWRGYVAEGDALEEEEYFGEEEEPEAAAEDSEELEAEEEIDDEGFEEEELEEEELEEDADLEEEAEPDDEPVLEEEPEEEDETEQEEEQEEAVAAAEPVQEDEKPTKSSGGGRSRSGGSATKSKSKSTGRRSSSKSSADGSGSSSRTSSRSSGNGRRSSSGTKGGSGRSRSKSQGGSKAKAGSGGKKGS